MQYMHRKTITATQNWFFSWKCLPFLNLLQICSIWARPERLCQGATFLWHFLTLCPKPPWSLVPGPWSGTTLIICPSVLCQTVSKVPPSISDAGWVFDYKSVPQLQGGVRVQVVLHKHLQWHRHNNRMCRSWIPSAVHSFRCASFLKILTWQ